MKKTSMHMFALAVAAVMTTGAVMSAGAQEAQEPWSNMEKHVGAPIDFLSPGLVYEVNTQQTKGWGTPHMEVTYRLRALNNQELAGTDATQEVYKVNVGCSNVQKTHLLERQSLRGEESIHRVDYRETNPAGRYMSPTKEDAPVLAYLVDNVCPAYNRQDMQDEDKDWFGYRD